MRMPDGFGTVGAKRALVVGVVITVVATMSVGMAGAQSASATPVDSCTTINTSGKYVLTGNITSNTTAMDEGCITITAGNVTLDGLGHTLWGSGTGYGVYVNGSARSVTNVTVKRLRASNWSVGIFYLSVDNGTVKGTVVDNNTGGIKLALSDGNRIVENTAYENAIGIGIGGESNNNTVVRNVVVENKWGIHFERDSVNNTVKHNVARNNTRWDFYSLDNSGTNAITDLELATTTISFSGQNVAFRSIPSPPPIPQGTRSLGTFLQVVGTGGEAFVSSWTMSYESTNGSVSLWRYDGQYWSKIERAQVDASANTVSVSNITEFGIFAVLADAPMSNGGPVNVTTDQPVSVQRTLTPIPRVTPTPTATPTSANAMTTNASKAPAVPTAVSLGSSNTSNESVGVHGKNKATTGLFGIGPLRLFFVLLGVVGLVALGVLAIKNRSEDEGPGFNR